MLHINILGTFIFIWLGYLIGSFSFSIIIGKHKFKTDVREHYSHNAGATNSTRVMGKKWGIIILLADGFKPIIAVLIAWGLTFIPITNTNWATLFTEAYVYYAGFGAIIGHCWPIFFGFRGGKGAAGSLGLLLIMNPIYFVVAVATWWLALYIWKMVSLSSVLMLSIVFIISWIPNMPVNAYLWPHDIQNNMTSWIIFLTWIIVIMRHWPNLMRVFDGTERKVTLFDKKKVTHKDPADKNKPKKSKVKIKNKKES